MKLYEVKEPGFYTMDKTRGLIFEVMNKEDETLFVDEWIFDYTDDDDISHYEYGHSYPIKYAAPIDVYKIEDTKYKVDNVYMREDKLTYKQKFFNLLEQDKGTISSLREVLTMVEANGVTCDYLRKIIEDFEKSIEEFCDEKSV